MKKLRLGDMKQLGHYLIVHEGWSWDPSPWVSDLGGFALNICVIVGPKDILIYKFTHRKTSFQGYVIKVV